MNIHLLYIGKPINDFKSLIDSYHISEFSSPRRSTIPLIIYWKNLRQRIPKFFSYMNLMPPGSIDACFEYAVPVQKGRGKDSYTDLMLLSQEQVIAIEGKYTEPPYDSVKKWLRNPPSENKIEVLEGWLELIEKVTGTILSIDDVTEIAYQLVHRTASACYPNAKRRFVVYQCFDLDNVKKNYYNEQIGLLRKIIGSSKILNLSLMSFPLEKRPDYTILERLWDQGERDLSNQVIKGIKDDALMNFGEPDIINFQ